MQINRQNSRRRAAQAILSALAGLLLGNIVYSMASATRVMLDPSVHTADGIGAWIVGWLLLLAVELSWTSVGGMLYVMPFVSIVFLVFAQYAGPAPINSNWRVALAAVLWFLIFGSLLVFGGSSGVIDAILLAIAIGLGVTCGVGMLGRRLSM